jgi:hypothetical protein
MLLLLSVTSLAKLLAGATMSVVTLSYVCCGTLVLVSAAIAQCSNNAYTCIAPCSDLLVLRSF